MIEHEFTHFGFCCGIGGGSAGFNDSRPSVGNVQARWRCLGGIDVSPGALRSFERLTGSRGTLMDLFSREQYTAFHGHEPAPGWKEATPEDIRRAAGFEDPDVVFISSPCKGASGLLSESKSRTPKYRALNELTLRCVWLMCEAWAHNPISLIVFENVHRLANRGRHLLDQINQLLGRYGYAVAETVHNCGEIGRLAQSRKRFLLVARHIEKVPAFLYQPQHHSLRGVGEILGRMPLPGDIEAAGPMHRLPRLEWKTWLRLALVEAGQDWRSLNRFAVQDGFLRDYLIVPQANHGYLGVHRWEDSTGTIAGASGPTNGAYSVADPRAPAEASQYQQYGVLGWDEASGAITGAKSPGQGTFSVADPRPQWDRHAGNYRVIPWAKPAATIIAGGKGVQGGWQSIADPRTLDRKPGDAWSGGGHYGVLAFNQPAGAVSASACHDNGRWSVADVRLPAANDRLECVIQSLDGTWHRPFTTLELAALQSLFDPEDIWSADPQNAAEIRRLQHAHLFELDGSNDGQHREWIGNAVPRRAAKAIADVMGTTLLLAAQGETFILSSLPVWVRPLAMAMSLSRRDREVLS